MMRTHVMVALADVTERFALRRVDRGVLVDRRHFGGSGSYHDWDGIDALVLAVVGRFPTVDEGTHVARRQRAVLEVAVADEIRADPLAAYLVGDERGFCSATTAEDAVECLRVLFDGCAWIVQLAAIRAELEARWAQRWPVGITAEPFMRRRLCT